MRACSDLERQLFEGDRMVLIYVLGMSTKFLFRVRMVLIYVFRLGGARNEYIVLIYVFGWC